QAIGVLVIGLAASTSHSGDLNRGALHTRVEGGRPGDEPAAIACPKDADTLPVDIGLTRDEGDRIANVGRLILKVHLPANGPGFDRPFPLLVRLRHLFEHQEPAITLAPAAIIEGQEEIAVLCEGGAEPRRESRLLDTTRAVNEDDGGKPVRGLQILRAV